MLAKRIIAALDIKNDLVCKGVKFKDIVYAGDPEELAVRYSEEGIDEVVFLDINASHESRDIFIHLVEKVAKKLTIPFTVGGGVRTIEDFRNLLLAGADKVFINSAAIKNKELITKAKDKFGSQCVVVAIDAKKREDNSGYDVYLNGGRINTGLDMFEWAKEVEALGAGEILLTGMDNDGTKAGFGIEMTKLLAENLNIPVIASGGAGSVEHFKEVFEEGKADAALAASLFHFNELKISDLKEYLKNNNIEMRI